MASARSPAPFHFLDLPAELRNMIYEYLPKKVTHHDFDYAEDGRGQKGHIVLVWTTLPGTILLQTCRQIKKEAEGIIKAKMAAIEPNTIRLIVTTKGLRSTRIKHFMECLSATELNCTFGKDLRNCLLTDAYENHTTHDSGPLTHREAKNVIIAIRKTGESSIWSRDGIHEVRNVLWRFALIFAGILKRQDRWPVDVDIRPALLSSEEQMVFKDIRRDIYSGITYPGHSTVWGSKQIRKAERKSDWSESDEW